MAPSLQRLTASMCCCASLIVAPRASAQDNNTAGQRVTVTAAVELSNRYSFRGVQQNSTEAVLWPTAGVRVRLYAGRGWLRQVAGLAETFNSLHTGDTGAAGPSERLWYETRTSGGVRLTTASALEIDARFTSYVSPNDLFDSAKEVAFTIAAVGESGSAFGRVQPYVLAAFEVDTGAGHGQLDGGMQGGTYLELGAAPELVRNSRLVVTVPVSVGMSLRNYYELAGRDHRFGFASIAGMATLPLGRTSQFGAWHVRTGIEYQHLGTTPRAFNRGDRSELVWRMGLAVSG